MSVEQACPDCGVTFEATDNYCRSCGMYLVTLRALEPVRRESRALEAARPGLPAPVKKAATAMAVGAALQIGVSVAGKYLARQAASSALSAVTPKAKPVRGSKDVPRVQAATRRKPAEVVERVDDEMGDAVAVAETFIFRRVWIRR